MGEWIQASSFLLSVVLPSPKITLSALGQQEGKENWLGYGCALALAKLFSFSKLKLNAHKINNKSDYGDLHKLEEIFINFQGVISTREDI